MHSFNCFIIGQSSLSTQCAEILLEHGHSVCGVFSTDAACLNWARSRAIVCTDSKQDLGSYLNAQPLDYLFSIVNSMVLPPEVFALPRIGSINYHDGPLPRYAGVNGTSWAIMNQESNHAVTWHEMAEWVDAGDILKQQNVNIAADETSLSLNAKCYQAAISSFAELVDELAEDRVVAQKQNLKQRTYFAKHQRPNRGGVISWHDTAEKIDALVRALEFGNYPNTLGVPKLAINDTFLVVSELQIAELKSEMPPGVITRIEANAVHVATATGDVVLRKLRTIDGEQLSWSDAVAKHGLHVGLQLEELDSETAQCITSRDQEISEHEAYWVGRLADFKTIGVPYANSEGNSSTCASDDEPLGVVPIALPNSLVHQLRAFFPVWKIGEILTAAFGAFLSRLGGVDQLDFGFPTEHRKSKNSKFSSLFAQTIPVRIDANPKHSLESVLNGLAGELKVVGRRKTFSRDVFQRYPELAAEGKICFPIVVQQVNEFEDHANSDAVNLKLVIAENLPACRLEFRQKNLNEAQATRIAEQFSNFLHGVAADPACPVGRLPLVNDSERQRLLVDFNDTAVDHPRDRCIHELFEDCVRRSPEAVAVVHAGRSTTYGELNRRANQLAHHLRQQGVEPNELVGICVERSLEMVVGILGILKSGGAYAPLDPAYPPERLAFMLEDMNVAVLVIQESLVERFAEPHPILVLLDSARNQWDTQHDFSSDSPSDTNPANLNTPEDRAYVIYTSGSSGQPKGVQIPHVGLVNLVSWHQRVFEVTAADQTAQMASFSFDASVWEIWPYLTAGSSIYLPDENTRLSPSLLMEWLSDCGITICFLPTPLAEIVLKEDWSNNSTLRIMLTGGDKLNRAPDNALPFELINNYGPTENTVVTTWTTIPTDGSDSAPPIGRPIDNTQVYVLDRHQQLVPIGVAGELCIGGTGLSPGYLNRPELTAEKFVSNPFASDPDARLYRSGDLVRFDSDGNLHFAGRIDEQVKVRGMRIELGEIESVLLKHSAVETAIVDVRKSQQGENRLIAYVVPTTTDLLPVTQLRDWLSRSLPTYMVPSTFVELKTIPLNANGKLDRAALRELKIHQTSNGQSIAPQTAGEKKLAKIWSEILDFPEVSLHDNFFEIGGDEVRAILLANRACQSGLKFTARDVFEHPTLQGLARVSTKVLATATTETVDSGSFPLSPIQQWFFDRNFSDWHHWNQAFMFSLKGTISTDLLQTAFAYVIAHHDALRLEFEKVAGKWRQHYLEKCRFQLNVEDLSNVPHGEQLRAITDSCSKLQTTLDPQQGRMLCAAYFELGPAADSRLFMAIHHLAIDTVSWRVVLEDLETAYRQLQSGEIVQLPAKTASFSQWSKRLMEYASSPELKTEEEFWQRMTSPVPRLLPPDMPESERDDESSSDAVVVKLSPAQTQALLYQVPRVYKTQINDLLLASLSLSLKRRTGSETVSLFLEGHGREELWDDLRVGRTVGWFTSLFPVLLKLPSDALGETIVSVRDQLREIPHRGFGYGVHRYLSEDRRSTPVSKPEFTFNYYGHIDRALTQSSLLELVSQPVGPLHSSTAERVANITINSQIFEGALEVHWEFNGLQYHRTTIESIADEYLAALNDLIEHCVEQEVELDPSAAQLPRDDTEKQLAKFWGELLERSDAIGIHENFFELGGHSLLGIQLISRIFATFNVELPLPALFKSPTIAGLAARLKKERQPTIASGGTPKHEKSHRRFHIPSIGPRNKQEVFVCPASFGQERLWIADRLDPNSSAYNEKSAFRLFGNLNVAALASALNEIVDRHEILRTNFETRDDQTWQVIAPELTLELPLVDLAHDADPESALQTWMTQETNRPFNLETDALLRVRLFKLAASEHVLLLNFHHIILDGWSGRVLFHELDEFYKSFKNDLGSTRPKPLIQYADYATWQREFLAGEELERNSSYWQKQLANLSPLMLPSDRPIPKSRTHEGATVELAFDRELVQALRAVGSREQATLFMTMIAAFYVLLHRYSGQDNFAIGVPMAGRSNTDLEGMLGFFINNLVLRGDLSGNPTFEEFLTRVREMALEAYAHEDMPFEKLVDALKPTRVAGRIPLFEVMFAMQNNRADALSLDGITAHFEPVPWNHAKLDLSLFLYDDGEDLRGVLEFSTDLFDFETIQRMTGQFQVLLRGIVSSPQSRLSELPLLTQAEIQQQVEQWNATQLDFVAQCTLAQAFEEQVARTPNAVALTCQNGSLTFHQLNDRAEAIASRLRAFGAQPEDIVGVHCERTLELVAGMLGVLKAGAAYLPLDPDYPVDRLSAMVDDAKPLVVLSTPQTHGRFQNPTIPEWILDGTNLTETAQISRRPHTDQGATSVADGNSLAYVIYTSGSLGKPKGVMVEHRNVMNFFAAMDEIFGRQPGTWLSVASVSFDISVLEIWWSLTRGFEVVIWPGIGNGATISELIRRHGVTHMQSVPSFLQMVMMQPDAIEALASLRLLVVGGETVPASLIQELGPAPNRRIIDMYGPTETTVISTFFPLEPAATDIVIGKPVANTQVYILDRNGALVPIGVEGELHIGGAGVARGYLQQPGLTEQKFVPNPFQNEPNERLYRTGDLARYRADGNLEFIGRLDAQVKIRGYRIELGEIEAVLDRHPAVSKSVVAVRDDRPGGKYLAGYYVAVQGHASDSTQLLEHLRSTLPEYMVPQFLSLVDSFPLTHNGKIDRQNLPAPQLETRRHAAAFVAPRNGTEEQLASIWGKVLGVPEVGVGDNFFDLGGHSLLAIQLVSQIDECFEVELPLQVLFEEATLAGLAEKIDNLVPPKESTNNSSAREETPTATESKLVEIWQQVLAVPTIDVGDSFVELQSTPEQLQQMLAKAKDAFGFYAEGLPVQEFLENPTIQQFARIIDSNRERKTKTPVVCFQSKGSKPPLFLIHAAGGYIFFYRALVSRLGMDRPIYGIRAETKADNWAQPFEKSKSIEQLAACYIREIKKIHPQGPYSLGGGCLGGVIAFEMARQLVGANEEVSGPILLFDSYIYQNPFADKLFLVPYRGAKLWKLRIFYHLTLAARTGVVGGAGYLTRVVGRNGLGLIKDIARGLAKLANRNELRRAVSDFRNRQKTGAIEQIWGEIKPETNHMRILQGFLKASARLLTRYVPGRYEGAVALFEDSKRGGLQKMWQGLALEGMQVYRMPGVHLDMMDEPAVIETAALVTQALGQTTTSYEADASESLMRAESRTGSQSVLAIENSLNAATVHSNGWHEKNGTQKQAPYNGHSTSSANLPHDTMTGLSKLMEYWEHGLLNRCITIMSRLGIADLLAIESQSIQQLAQQTGTHEPTLYRIMRLLCAHEIFVQSVDSKYSLTPISQCLRSDVPWSLRWSSVVAECLDQASTQLLHSVRTGDCPFDKVAGMSFWSYLEGDPTASDWFNREMQSHCHTLVVPALLALNWDQSDVVVDVGGGTGQTLCSLLQGQSHLQGILVDQPQVMERARTVVNEAGVESRCQLQSADMFRSVPQGADTYLLSRVLHDWNDDDAIRILKTIRESIPVSGRLLLLEMIVPEGNQPHISKAADLSMLLLFGGGRERTRVEFIRLLEASGFQISEIRKGRGILSVLEAVVGDESHAQEGVVAGVSGERYLYS